MSRPVEYIKDSYNRNKELLRHAEYLLKDMNPDHYAFDALSKMRDRLGSSLYEMVRDCPELLK